MNPDPNIVAEPKHIMMGGTDTRRYSKALRQTGLPSKQLERDWAGTQGQHHGASIAIKQDPTKSYHIPATMHTGDKKPLTMHQTPRPIATMLPIRVIAFVTCRHRVDIPSVDWALELSLRIKFE